MTECDICTDFELLQKATCDDKAFRWGVLTSLCYITTQLATQETPLPPTTYILTPVTKTATEVESGFASYATVGLITSNKKLNRIRIVNTLDTDLEFSLNTGVSTAFTVLANTTYVEDLNITLAATTSLQMRKVGTATIGSVIIEGRYLA